MAKEAAQEHARTPWREEVWARLAGNIKFVGGSFDDDDAFDQLAETLDDLCDTHRIQGNAAFYLSIPPPAFPTVLKQMDRTGMADNHKSGGWRRVVVEKPFGSDLRSAKQLNSLVDDVFTAHDVFRIDHYLGKETVQNILALRFANTLFEPVWNSKYVDSVQITMAEDVGIGGRAGFYDGAGAARDVLQNHLLQLLALIAMEEPTSFDAAEIRTEKLKVLRAITVPADIDEGTVRGQYQQGWVAGERAVGYLEEKDIPADVDHGDLRGGAARHRDPPLGRGAVLHADRQAHAAPGHRDRGHVQGRAAPAVREGRRRVARPQPAGRPRPARRGRHAEVRLEGARHHDGGPRHRDGLPVRRGVHRVLPGGVRAADPGRADRRPHAVPRRREVEAGWRVIDPLEKVWAGTKPDPYRAGEWGPRTADEMLARDGRTWRRA